MNNLKIVLYCCFLFIITYCSESEKEEIENVHENVKDNTNSNDMSEAERLLEELKRDSFTYEYKQGDSLTEEEKGAFD